MDGGEGQEEEGETNIAVGRNFCLFLGKKGCWFMGGVV